MPKVSEEYKAKRREMIYEYALECFAEKGFQLTTMDDIVKKSNTSKGFVYSYFKSKEELYVSLMEEKTANMFVKIEDRFRKLATAKEKIAELFHIYRKNGGMEKYKVITRAQIEYTLYSSRVEELQKNMRDRFEKQHLPFIKRIISEGIANGEFNPNANPEMLASMFWANIDGTALHNAILDSHYKYQEVLAETEKMFLKYLEID
ncbi:TetR/AcrR family transcriptional regulator [Pseudoneobacillus sp. C159]